MIIKSQAEFERDYIEQQRAKTRRIILNRVHNVSDAKFMQEQWPTEYAIAGLKIPNTRLKELNMATPQTFDYYCQLLKNQHGLNGVEAAKVAAQLVLADKLERIINEGLTLNTNYPLRLEVGFIGDGSGLFDGRLDVSLHTHEPVQVQLEED